MSQSSGEGPGRRYEGSASLKVPTPSDREPSHLSNGPTEAINGLTKRIKPVAFGFRQFKHFRIRALLYAGKPNWDLLATITPR
jgi:Transposase